MEINEEYYIEIPNEIPQKEEVCNYTIMVYILLVHFKTIYGYGITSIRQIGEMLRYKRIDKYTQEIKEALDDLIMLDYIDIYDLSQNPMEVKDLANNTSFYVTYLELEGCYFKVFLDDIKKIIWTYDKYSIRDLSSFIRYYLVIQRWTNFNDDIAGHHVSNKSVRHIVADNRTIQKYNDTLEEMQIFWYENGYRSSKDNRVIATRFARCRVISKSDFSREVEAWAWKNGYVAYDKLGVNQKRSITQLHNWEKKKEKANKAIEQAEINAERQRVLEQFVCISDQYLSQLLEQWQCTGKITVEGLKELIVQNRIILTGDEYTDASSSLRDKVIDRVIGF